MPAERCGACSSRSAASNRSARASTVYKLGAIDVSLPRRESKTGRGHRGFDVDGRPGDERRGGRAPARLHDQRHRLGSAHRRVSRSVRRTRRPRRAAAPRRRPARRSRDDSLRVLRAVQFAARFELELDDGTTGALPRRSRSTTCRPNACGARSRSCCCAPRPSIGFALALDLGVVDAAAVPSSQALVGCEQEPEWHPEGDVWVHTLHGDRPGAHAHRRPRPRPAPIAVMLGAVCHDLGKPATTAFVDGRIRSIGSRGGGRGAGDGRSSTG